MANKITVTSAGTVVNANVTPDSAMYYSNKSKEWAISDRIVDNTDYSSKYYANESKKQADISTAKATEVVESGNNAVLNIENARDNAITNVNTAGATQVALATEQATIATNKASEVIESGNTALSNIDTAKDNAITSITNQETTSKNNVIAIGNEQVAIIEATGNNYDNLTHKNITNCLLEVPQRIKLELNNGILTLKAGSQVIVPNGFEADGTTPKFDEVVINNDISQTVTSAWPTGKPIICYNRTDNAFLCRTAHASGTSPSGDYTIYYNTATNVVRDTNITDKEISLPIGFATVGNLAFTSIDQVFNGMGYIGSTVWVDKGVKGLIPNGRNADGSLKNIEYATPNLRTRTCTGNGSTEIAIGSNGDLNIYGYFTMSDENYLVGNNGNKVIGVSIANVYMTNNVITSFQPKLPFRAVDYNDKSEISGWSMPSDKFIDLTLGADGSTYIAPANGWFVLSKRSTGSNQILRLSSTSTRLGFKYASTGAQGCIVSCPVKKGDIIKCGYTTTGVTEFFRFIYAEGSK